MKPKANSPFCFVIKMSLIPAVFAAIYIGLFIHPTSFIYSKHERLLNSPSPKLVFTGGSNGLYGIDSEYLENSIHMPVINYSIRAYTPISFYINEIKPTLHDGDVVILFLEYGYYYGSVSDRAISQIIETYPAGIPHLLPGSFSDFPHLVKETFPAGYEKLKIGALGKKNNKFINEWGDAVDMLDFKGKIKQNTDDDIFLPVDAIDDDVIRQLNEFSRYASARGANVVVIYPSLQKSLYTGASANADALDTYLRTHLEFPVLGTPERYAFDDLYLSNSYYHMNRQGRQLRTEMVIEDLLKNHLIVQNGK
jgi:hypothetical protein